MLHSHVVNFDARSHHIRSLRSEPEASRPLLDVKTGDKHTNDTLNIFSHSSWRACVYSLHPREAIRDGIYKYSPIWKNTFCKIVRSEAYHVVTLYNTDRGNSLQILFSIVFDLWRNFISLMLPGLPKMRARSVAHRRKFLR